MAVVTVGIVLGSQVTVSRKEVVMMEESQPTPQQNTHLRERVSYGQEHLDRGENMNMPLQPPAMVGLPMDSILYVPVPGRKCLLRIWIASLRS